VAAVAPFVGPVVATDEHAAAVGAVRRYLAGREPLFLARTAAGDVCDGHGDLQADDVYCLDDGPRILDCLEFDDRLRYGDVVADVAFLAMDLERLGAPEAARRFVAEYERLAGVPLPRSLLDVFIALRAYVRVKVACLRHEQGDGAAAGQAAGLLALARAHLDRGRVRLVLVGGLPGSGKSTLATGLGAALGATVLRSDEIRGEYAPPRSDVASESDAPTAFGRGRYSETRTQAVYDELLRVARTRLGHGESVILDASWTHASRRDRARALAFETSSDLSELRCVAPDPVIERRIAERLERGTDPSEATVAVARAMARHGDPWPAAVTVDTTGTPGATLDAARRAIDGHVEA
jgi:predicted kinase